MTEVKFREAIYKDGKFCRFHYWSYPQNNKASLLAKNLSIEANEQFTGLQDKDGSDVYEGDVFRIEIEHDHGDERDYAIVTWIKEWCMFATLLSGEYKEYLDQGASILDEVMFWSYTLQDASENKIIGNIHETPISKG